MRRQERPASWFAELCEVADFGRKARRGRRMAPRQTSRKGTSRHLGYRIWQQTARIFVTRVANAISLPCARGVGRACWSGALSAGCDSSEASNMNSVAATLVIESGEGQPLS
jgi:hypothetical protein